MAHEFKHPILGQEAICPDGLGRVVAFRDEFPFQWIKVSTYLGDPSCDWDPENVELIDPRRGKADLKDITIRVEGIEFELKEYMQKILRG